jgi:hypothetical protein
MAAFGNIMWGTGELNPSNFAGNGTHNQAVAANNKKANPPLSDSFIGAPLAMGSDSPPAGPIEESLRGVGAGWSGLPIEGKLAMPIISGLSGWATTGLSGSIVVGITTTVAVFLLLDNAETNWRTGK